MTTDNTSTYPVLLDGLGGRLRAARERRGLMQGDVADLGSVSRATQISYERSTTEPTTAYLRAIQQAKIDIGFVLFGSTAGHLGSGIAWDLVQKAHDAVEFFCLANAPTCPQSYRWKLVAAMYVELSLLTDPDSPGASIADADTLALVAKCWAQLLKNATVGQAD